MWIHALTVLGTFMLLSLREILDRGLWPLERYRLAVTTACMGLWTPKPFRQPLCAVDVSAIHEMLAGKI